MDSNNPAAHPTGGLISSRYFPHAMLVAAVSLALGDELTRMEPWDAPRVGRFILRLVPVVLGIVAPGIPLPFRRQ
jgi:hypothetical protein